MTIQLNKQAYQQLIDQDIEELNKFMPEHSLERKHIVDVLNWSVDKIYNNHNTELDWLKDEE